jgi:hypothetical protein
VELNFVQTTYIVTFCYSLICLPGCNYEIFHVPCRYMCAHALSLSHPGIRCRCLAAYGDPVSAVKWYVCGAMEYCLFLRLGPEKNNNIYTHYAGQRDLAESITMTWLSLCWVWAMPLKLFICLEYLRGKTFVFAYLSCVLYDVTC